MISNIEVPCFGVLNTFEEGRKAKKLQILIVDDFVYNILVLEEMFEDFGNIDYQKAMNGEQALEMVRKHCINEGRYFDFILMDISMPVMNGLDCAKELRRMERVN